MEPHKMDMAQRNYTKQDIATLEQGVEHLRDHLQAVVGEDLKPLDARIRPLPLSEFPSILGGPEVESVGVYIPILGDVQGQLMFIATSHDAITLLDDFQLRSDVLPGELDAFDRLRLAEISAGLGNAFVEQVKRITRREVYLSAPVVMLDMAGSILDLAVTKLCQGLELVLALEFSLVHSVQNHVYKVWLIPDLIDGMMR